MELLVLPRGKGRNPEGMYGGFRVKHGVANCKVMRGTLHYNCHTEIGLS